MKGRCVMTKRGIDVSYAQGNIDWSKAKGEISFAILRAGYGNAMAYPSQIDNTFERNYKGCKSAGIPCGVYWYSYAGSIEAARQEAKSCLSVIKGKKFEYPIFFDLEEASQFARGRAFCDSIVKAFCEEIEKAGYYAGLYMSRSPLQSYISDSVAKKYALWIAEYNSKCNYNGDYAMWQYSSTGRINGISGNVDMDYCYKDFPTIIKKGGYNGYEKTVVKVLDSNGYKRGDKGVGVYAYKQLLKLACKKMDISISIADDGGFGGGTEKATNAVLKKLGYKQNGIAGKKLIKKLSNKIK